MKNHCLIDYENTHEDGLKGIFGLSEEDTVYIFYTKNANNISLDFLSDMIAKGVKAKLLFFKVPSGKQSLDMRLNNYLGYLIGQEKDKNNHYIIVSKDQGYSNTIEYWNEIFKNIIEQRVEIGKMDAVNNVPEAKQEEEDPKVVALNIKSELNQKVQKILSKDKKYNNEQISQAASIVVKCYNKKNIKQVLYRSLIKKLGQKEGLEIYNILKKSGIIGK